MDCTKLSNTSYMTCKGEEGSSLLIPPKTPFCFFVMLQRCTSSIRGAADSVKFYIVFFFFKLQAILYFSQCITIVFAGSYSTVRNLCWFISVYVFASFQNMFKPFRKQIQILIASKTTKTRHQKGKTIIPSLARQQVATKKISCLAEEGEWVRSLSAN